MSTRVSLVADFGRAVHRLEEVLGLEESEIVRDSAIKRFELCFDLAWKCLQAYARREGLECQSPRSCLKTAVQLGLLEHDDTWLKMLEDRNLAVHTYRERYANELHDRLAGYLTLLSGLSEKLTA